MPNDLPILLLTRPMAASQRFRDEVQALGSIRFHPVICPLMEIRFADTLPKMSDLDGVIFTSSHGVQAYLALGGRADIPCYVIGTATTQMALAQGLNAQCAGGDADELVAYMAKSVGQGRLMHLRGQHTVGRVSARLTALGMPTGEAVIYDQVAIPPTEAARACLEGGQPIVAPIFSARSAQLFGALMPKAPLFVAAMSDTVANAVSAHHIIAKEVAARPESTAMAHVTAQLLEKAKAYQSGAHQ